MTAKDKISLIGRMIADVIKFTEFDSSAMDALISCIGSVVDFETEED